MADANILHPDVRAFAAHMGIDLDTHVFPYGYSGQHITLVSIASKNQIKGLNPEVLRRIFCWMILCAAFGVPLGIGGGARYFAQQEAEFFRRHVTYNTGRSSRTYLGVRYWLLPGMAAYAPPGNSKHEEKASPEGALAADMIPPSSLSVANQSNQDFGLKDATFVNDEPWHNDPLEQPSSRSKTDAWYAAGHTLPVWPIETGNGNVTIVVTEPVTNNPQPYAPPAPKTNDEVVTMHTITAQFAEVKEGSRGTDAARVQALLNALSGSDLDIDGYFGTLSTTQLRNVQKFCGLTADGICGPITWKVLLEG